MRIVELLNNINLPVTNEEAEILDRFGESSRLLKSDLDPRQQLIANNLVNKDVLIRIQEYGRIIYRKRTR